KLLDVLVSSLSVASAFQQHHLSHYSAEGFGFEVHDAISHLLIFDKGSVRILINLNPNSFRRMVGTLLEVNGRGYWETSDENIEKLQEIYAEVEDRIEGIE
ncbi:MAG: cobaltochelatase subunit CobN, partial [Cyanobacteria bacterium P01_G01_bin.4]